MGKNSKQIATKTDVNAKRIGSFATSNECVTKADVMELEGLTVTDNTTSSSVTTFAIGEYASSNQWTCTYKTFNNTTVSVPELDVISSNNLYNVQFVNSTSITLGNPVNHHFIVEWSNRNQGYSYSTGDLLFYQTHYLSEGRHKWGLSLNSILNFNSTKSTSTSSIHMIHECSVTYSLAVFSSNGLLLAFTAPMTTNSVNFSNSIEFIVPYSGTVYLGVVLYSIRFLHNSPLLSQMSYAYCSFGFQIESSAVITYNSYYDTTYKLVQYNDIKRTSFTFDLYYGIWNTKTIKAKLDYVRVYISTSNDASTGTWTQVGDKSISAVDKTAKGVVSVTIPANVNLGTQYYLKVRCGNTDNEQQWSCRWADCDDIKSYTFPSSKKTTWMDLGPVPLTSLSNSVLNDSSFGGYYGRSATNAACFKID